MFRPVYLHVTYAVFVETGHLWNKVRLKDIDMKRLVIGRIKQFIVKQRFVFVFRISFSTFVWRLNEYSFYL